MAKAGKFFLCSATKIWQDRSHQWSTRPAHSPGRQWLSLDFAVLGQAICVEIIITENVVGLVDRLVQFNLFLFQDKKSYQALGFISMSATDLVPGILSLQALKAGASATWQGLGGNPWGDGMQMGGLLIVGKGGDRVIFSFVQQRPSDEVEGHKILKLLDEAKEFKS